jgi:hypothetical protein
MVFIIMVSLIVGLAKMKSGRGRMARGGRGFPKASPRPPMPYPSMPYPSMPCGQTTLETALQPFQGWRGLCARRPAAVFYPLGHPTPMHLSNGITRCSGPRFVYSRLSRNVFRAAIPRSGQQVGKGMAALRTPNEACDSVPGEFHDQGNNV